MDENRTIFSTTRGPFSWPARCPLTPKDWSYLHRKYHLSPRELQSAICICSGCNNAQLAKTLGITVNTAKVYVREVYRRTGVNNKVLLLLKFLSDVSPLDKVV